MKPEFTKKPEFMILAAEQKRNAPPMFLELLIFFAVYIIASLAIGLIGSVPMLIWLFGGGRSLALLELGSTNAMLDQVVNLLLNPPVWLQIVLLALSALLGLAAILYCTKFEKRSLRSMGLTRPHALRHYGSGALFGAVSFSAAFGLTALLGGVRLEGVNPLGSVWPMLLLMLAAFVVQSAGEELLLRGYFMTSLSKNARLPASIFVSSIVFGLLHISNPGAGPAAFANVALVGVVLGLYILLTGDLWGACGYHALWNFFQSSVFGISVSGIDLGTSLFRVSVTGQNKLLTGGEFGLEGSLCTTMILLVQIAALVWFLYRRPNDAVVSE